MPEHFCGGLYTGNANVKRRSGNFAREAADRVRQPDAGGCGWQQRDAARQWDSTDPI